MQSKQDRGPNSSAPEQRAPDQALYVPRHKRDPGLAPPRGQEYSRTPPLRGQEYARISPQSQTGYGRGSEDSSQPRKRKLNEHPSRRPPIVRGNSGRRPPMVGSDSQMFGRDDVEMMEQDDQQAHKQWWGDMEVEKTTRRKLHANQTTQKAFNRHDEQQSSRFERPSNPTNRNHQQPKFGRGKGRRRGRAQQQPQPPQRAMNERPKQQAQPPPETKPSAKKRKGFMTDSHFDVLEISEKVKRSMRDCFQYDTMTRVQKLTIPESLRGGDVVAQAKTGTGKTLAFLIPAIERVTVNESAVGATVKSKSRFQKGDVRVLIISPTRELANQIHKEATTLVRFTPNISPVSMVGGVNKSRDNKVIRQKRLEVLVATPGRLLDHLNNTNGFSSMFHRLGVLILDEADQMLEMGFRPDLLRIIAFLPKERQTLLFSATMHSSLREVCKLAVKPGYNFINTIPEADQHTHKKVGQQVLVAPLEEMFQLVVREINREISNRPQIFKVMIFFVTARLTGFFAETCRDKLKLPVVEMHSRKSQSFRQKAAKRFRDNNQLLMFTSDVSARGVDYPDVTLILQVGITEREPYIHRLGRTARAASGIEGRGLMILSDFERRYVMNNLNDLPITQIEHIPTSQSDPEISRRCEIALSHMSADNRLGAQAYQSWLGFYNGYLKKLRWGKDDLVTHANILARAINAIDEYGNPPYIFKRTAAKMRLKGVKGIRTISMQEFNRNNPKSNNSGRGRGRGRGRR